MPRANGTQVARADEGLFVTFTGESVTKIMHELVVTPTQITRALADVASADHNVCVLSLLAALEYERHSDERCVGSLWLALERAVQLWRAERIQHSTTPAASTQQVLGGRQRFAVKREGNSDE